MSNRPRYDELKELLNRTVDAADTALNRESEERLRAAAATLHEAMVKEGIVQPASEEPVQ